MSKEWHFNLGMAIGVLGMSIISIEASRYLALAIAGGIVSIPWLIALMAYAIGTRVNR